MLPSAAAGPTDTSTVSGLPDWLIVPLTCTDFTSAVAVLTLASASFALSLSMPLPLLPPPQPATRAALRSAATRCGVRRGRRVTRPDPTRAPARLGAAEPGRYGGNLRSMASGTATRVFLARLAGLTVLDPNGDQVGRIRDIVVLLRTGAQPPRVLGLVVEVQPRRRVFVPMGQVTSVDADAVIVRGRINLRRFERRAGETLVITELLDRKGSLVEDSSSVTVVDVAMDQSRTRDWFVTRVAVRSGGGFRRRGQLQTVDWDQVVGFTHPEEDQGAANLLAAFDQLRAADLAHVMHELSAKRRAEVAAALDD